MMKVKLFSRWGVNYDGSDRARDRIENDINQFGLEHSILNVSITYEIKDNLHIYCAAVTYEE